MDRQCHRRLTAARRAIAAIALLGITSVLLVAAPALAAGGGKAATQLVQVADTRDMGPGFAKWTADLYNTNLWLFSAATVAIMVAMGLLLGWGCDKLIGLLGINLGKLSHHE
jgi:hypothetical protein